MGLAVPQVGELRRCIVIDTSPRQEGQRLIHLVNPEIVRLEGETTYTEGCLSIPGEAEDVLRAAKVWVRALDYHGKPFELEADGLLAVCVQHEMDHLEGKLFVDYLSELKRTRIRKKLEKGRRERGSAQPSRDHSKVPVI